MRTIAPEHVRVLPKNNQGQLHNYRLRPDFGSTISEHRWHRSTLVVRGFGKLWAFYFICFSISRRRNAGTAPSHLGARPNIYGKNNAVISGRG